MALRRAIPAGFLWRRPQLLTDALRRTFATDDSHDDFKPKVKKTPTQDEVSEMIKKDIMNHKVFLYMKGTPDAPQCGFSNRAARVLDAYGVTYGSRNVLSDPAIREGVKLFSNWPTIPQIFINGEFVGGADILYNMHETGDLEKLLKGAGALK